MMIMTMTMMVRLMKNHLYPTFLPAKLKGSTATATACVMISKRKGLY